MQKPPFEATSKRVKLVQAAGLLTALGAVAAGALYRHDVTPQRAAAIAAGGVGVWVLGRMWAWWRHG